MFGCCHLLAAKFTPDHLHGFSLTWLVPVESYTYFFYFGEGKFAKVNMYTDYLSLHFDLQFYFLLGLLDEQILVQ